MGETSVSGDIARTLFRLFVMWSESRITEDVLEGAVDFVVAATKSNECAIGAVGRIQYAKPKSKQETLNTTNNKRVESKISVAWAPKRLYHTYRYDK